MDGPAHADLKRRLLDEFSTKYVKTMIDAATHEIVLDSRCELLAGEQVDLFAFSQDFGRLMVCEMIGVWADPDH